MKRQQRKPTYITTAVMEFQGRKKLGALPGVEARSPLTQKLHLTLAHPDSYIRIPLPNGTAAERNTMIYNLRDKARRAKSVLQFRLATDQKTLYAWLEAPRAQSSEETTV